MKTGAFLIIALVFPLTIKACLPRALKDQAITILCNYPVYDDRTTCKQAEIVKIVEYKTSFGEKEARSQSFFCVEMRFVDLTGESGVAVIWLFAPQDNSRFEVYSGPQFGSHCQ